MRPAPALAASCLLLAASAAAQDDAALAMREALARSRARAQEVQRSEPARLDCRPDSPSRARTAKKGLDIGPTVSGLSVDVIRCLAPDWYYTWGSDQNPSLRAAGVPFVPMVRGTGKDQSGPVAQRQMEVDKDLGLMAAMSPPPDTILLFNEPDLQRYQFQKRTSHDGRYGPPQTPVDGAVDAWRRIRERFPNAKLGAPKMAGAGDLATRDLTRDEPCAPKTPYDSAGRDGPYQSYVHEHGAQAMCRDYLDSQQWLPQFVAKTGSERPFDYAMMQWYGDADVAAFERAVEARWQRYRLPVIITEFAVSDADDVRDTAYRLSGRNKYDDQADKVEHFMRCALSWLEANPHVKAYAWMAAPPESLTQKDASGRMVPSAMISIRPSRLWDERYGLTRLGGIYALGGRLAPGETCP